jgi:hypothetical protein
MGYAKIENVGRVVKRMLERDGGATLRELKAELEIKLPLVHTSTGPSKDVDMVLIAMDYAVHELAFTGVIAPSNPTTKQEQLYDQYLSYEDRDWKWADDGSTVFDDVRWMPKKRVPVVKHLST